MFTKKHHKVYDIIPNYSTTEEPGKCDMFSKSTDANGEVVRMVASADRSFKAAIITMPRGLKDVHNK